MAQNRRQIIKTQRKKKSVLRHVEHQNQTTSTETENITDTVSMSETGNQSKDSPSLKSVLKSVIKPSTSKWANTPTNPILVTPELKPNLDPDELTPEVEKKNTPTTAPKVKSSGAVGNLGTNLRGLVKEKFQDTSLGQILDTFKNFREDMHDMMLSDEQRADKDLKLKIEADKAEALAKAKESKLQLDALERAREGGMSDEDFKKYSRDLFASQKIYPGRSGDGQTTTTLEEDIHAMREALEKSISQNNKVVDLDQQVKKEDIQEVEKVKVSQDNLVGPTLENKLSDVKSYISQNNKVVDLDQQVKKEDIQETKEHNQEVEKVQVSQDKLIIDELKTIDKNTADAAKTAAASAAKSENDTSIAGKFKKKTLGKVLDFAKNKIPGVGSTLERGATGLGKAPAGIAGPAIAEAASGAGLLGTLGAGVGSLGAGTLALGATAAGALGYGAGSLLYNNSETVREGAGNVMEGLFGHIKTQDEMETERKSSPEYKAAMDEARARKIQRDKTAQLVKSEPTTPADNLQKVELKQNDVQSLERQRNIANTTDAAIQNYDEKIKKSKEQENQPTTVKPQNLPQFITTGANSSNQMNIAPRNTENTLQRLQEKMFRSAVV